MKNKLSIFVFIAMLLLPTLNFAQEKQNLKVLYVGYSPEKEMPKNLGVVGLAGMSQERFEQEYPKRMPAFKTYLENYFTSVQTVDARDYNEAMSVSVDVTIFDQNPKPIKESIVHRDSVTGAFLSMEPSKIVSDNFNYPSVFIGHTADYVGRSLGSKLDWYCLCLDKYALEIKMEHAIFKEPFKVDLTLENRSTPAPIFTYPNGFDMPAEIPMWKVNTEGYHDGNGFRIGMVARGWGFEDSPDAEVISSGVSDKDLSAVALGRHGNFFLWGFAGSPEYMTEEAKKVFANVIVYTYKHKDSRIITKKYNDRIATKEYVDELLNYTTIKSYNDFIKFLESFDERMFAEKKAAEEEKEKGEELNEEERRALNYQAQQKLTREQFLQKRIGRNSFSKVTGLDTLAVRKYLIENRPYFYSEPDGFYDLKLDEDVKSLGLANTDLQVIETAIKMFSKGEDVPKAKRILWRYTLESFETASEWRKWYRKYIHKFFFTQAGGFIWMINDESANPNVKPRNDADIPF